MQIGDLFVKLADGNPLSQEEKQLLRLYGNQTQLNNSFVAGLKNGQSSITVDSVNVTGNIYTGKDVVSGVAVRLRRTSAFTIPSGTTTIQWNEEEYDDANFFDISVSNTDIIVPLTGIYNVTIGFYVKAGSAANHHYVSTFRGGSSYYPTVGAYLGATQNYILSATDERTYEKGEAVNVRASHLSGVDSTVETAYFTMRLIRS